MKPITITLFKKTLRDPKRFGYYLNITNNGIRKKQSLGITGWVNPVGPLQIAENTDAERLAEIVKSKKTIELQQNYYGVEDPNKTARNFFDFAGEYMKLYKKSDFRNVNNALRHFKEFCALRKMDTLPGYRVDKLLMVDFSEYVKEKFVGEGRDSYWKRFKKVMIRFHDEGYTKFNPGSVRVSFKTDTSLRKQVLTEDELRLLMATHCGNENVKRMFLFCCNTGLRWGDASKLKWSSIKAGKLSLSQSKTGQSVIIPLNASSQKLLGEHGKPNELIFPIGSWQGVSKVLRNWVTRAGIDKHITPHCARHTFCSILMNKGIDYRTIISLMGWSEGSGMKQILRYARLMDGSAKKAVDSLPDLF
jgi:integrase